MRFGLPNAFPLLDSLALAPYVGSLFARTRPAFAGDDEERPCNCTECPDYPTMSPVDVALATAFDHAACAYRWLCGARPSSHEWLRIMNEVDRARTLFRAHGWIDAPTTYHVAPPPLDAPTLSARRSRGRDFVHLSFESGYEPHPGEPGRDRWLGYAKNRTAHAWILQRSQPDRPWIVCIHGYGMGYPFMEFEAFPVRKLYERLGCNIVMPVLPLHGPRRVGRVSGERFLDGDILDTVHAEAQAMWDLRRIMGWIRAQQPASIGLYGLSLGGYNAALLASLESDLSCVVAGIPAVELLSLAQMHTPASSLRRAERNGISWSAVGEVMRVIAPLAMRAKVTRDRLFICAGSCDRIVPPQQALDLWEHWGRPHLAWFGGGHFSFRWAPAVRQMLVAAVTRTMLDSPAESAAA